MPRAIGTSERRLARRLASSPVGSGRALIEPLSMGEGMNGFEPTHATLHTTSHEQETARWRYVAYCPR
jgi:hypothetical protein